MPASIARGERRVRPSAERAGSSAVRTRHRRSRTVSPVATQRAPLDEAANASLDPHRASSGHFKPVPKKGHVLYDPRTAAREEHSVHEPAASETRQGSLHFYEPPMTFRDGVEAEWRMQRLQQRPVAPGERRRGAPSVGSGSVTVSEASMSASAMGSC
eukprot:CAMPEP_0114260166 /NCGR_PEP_ID=MMETSP0058-20121206/20317_1 /TAXON_ID=36894 /ORGANISM="Pyramimonas parkeae, CCMP726" /LENGTH=157 /DNA_ID=CAMNT_0001375333 /DNA_START=829 /DNA_END=1299 /DNA_ORIENTATION=+